jgi:hypothetical protein
LKAREFVPFWRAFGSCVLAPATALRLSWSVLAVCWASSGTAAEELENQVQAGPLYHEFSLTLKPGVRTEILGPLFSFEQGEDELSLSRWTPLLSHFTDEGTDSEEWDFAYPFLTYDRYGSEYRFQIGQLFSIAGGENQQSNIQSRFTLFPFYFHQRSTDPSLNYTAVFPFYGHLRNRLFRSEIDFVMWPLYIKTQRRPSAQVPLADDPLRALPYRFMQARRGDITTYNYLFPIFHLRYGEGLRGWQVWPLAGHERKTPTSSTNMWGEVLTVAGHYKVSVLWPIFFWNDLGLGTDNPEKQRVLLPLFSTLRSPKRDSSTYLWPFFTFTDDRARKYREFNFMGPLVVFARGEGKTVNRVWPFYSQASNAHLRSDFFLWPIYKYNAVHAPPLDRRRTRIVFFLYSDLREKDIESGEMFHRVDFWPFYSMRRERNGNRRLQIFAPLEPYLPHNKSIERNYSPLWSIWRSESNAQTGAASQSLLWNLYRRERTPATRKCSLLFGLFQYQSTPEQRRARLFYIPVMKQSKRPQADGQSS